MRSSARWVGFTAGLALWLLGCGRTPPPKEEVPFVVRVQPVEAVTSALLHRASDGQTYLGLIRGETETDLSFRVGGMIESLGRANAPLDWHEGDAVAKDELLAALHPVDFLATSNQARAKLDFEAARWTNNSKLYAEKAISAQEWDAIQSAYRSARAEYERAVQTLGDSEIRAPFAGTIISRLASRGETVMPGRPVLRVADLKIASVELGVPDRIITHVQPGDQIPVWVRALETAPTGPQRTGTVSEVGAAAREGSRLFKVVVKVPNQDGSLRPGMTGSVEFKEAREVPPHAVLVPLSALVAASTSASNHLAPLAVYVVGTDRRVHERPVQADDLIRSSVIVRDGLQPGESVVVVGAATLHDGARVDPRPVE